MKFSNTFENKVYGYGIMVIYFQAEIFTIYVFLKYIYFIIRYIILNFMVGFVYDLGRC